MAVVWRTPVLRAIAVGFWGAVLCSAADDLSIPFLVTDELGGGPVAVGVLLAAAAVGLLAGLPLVGTVGRRTTAAGAVVAGLAGTGVGNLLTAVAPVLAAAFAAQVVRGLSLAVLDGFVTTSVQRSVPPRLLGRALANVYGGVSVAAALGLLAAGPLVDATSPRLALGIAGVGALAGAGVVASGVRPAGAAPAVRPRRGT
jgi:predicted MFS family arabinose efflux permease